MNNHIRIHVTTDDGNTSVFVVNRDATGGPFIPVKDGMARFIRSEGDDNLWMADIPLTRIVTIRM